MGKKLNKDVSRYEKEIKSSNITPIKKTTKPIKKEKKPVYKNSSYNVKDVYTKNNTIIINFKHYINKDFIKFMEEKKSYRYIKTFDLKGRFEEAGPTKLKITGIDRIRITQHKFRTLRIQVTNKKNLRPIYILNKKQIIIKFPNIKVSNKKVEKKPITNKVNSRQRVTRNKVIVIDSGHGGKDSGAVGTNRRYEKHVVFAVSKELYKILKQRGYKVYLTRTKDKFIKVKKRTVLANTKKADIFLSIHANAAPKSNRLKARGIETYFLSPARSERAKRVAALENKSDIEDMSFNSKNTLLTILNQNKITLSQKLGIDIHQHMLYSARKRYKDVVDGGVREGPFWVLVGAQMPSVLIELGYITHKEESRRLFEKSYQKRLATGIADGIDSFFAKNH